MPASFDDVARLAQAMPGVTLGERYGNRTWFVAGKAFAWERPFSKADVKRFGEQVPPAGPILAVRVADLFEKDAALAAQPASFFTIPHFDGYAAVLIQLRKVTPRALLEALHHAYQACAPRRNARVPSGRDRGTPSKAREARVAPTPSLRARGRMSRTSKTAKAGSPTSRIAKKAKKAKGRPSSGAL